MAGWTKIGNIKGDPGPTGSQGPAGAPGTPGQNGAGVPTGGAGGQVLSKIDATNYNTQWVTPGSGLTLPLSQNLTFSPDTTYDIGQSAANRPRDLFVGRNETVAGTLTLAADPAAPLQAATKQYADTKLTQAQGDSRYALTAQGVPTGGTTGQVLSKKTNTDYDTQWVAQSGGGSSAVQVYEAQGVSGTTVTLPAT